MTLLDEHTVEDWQSVLSGYLLADIIYKEEKIMAKKFKYYICEECGCRGFRTSTCPQCEEEDMLTAVYEDEDTGEESRVSYLSRLF